MAVKFNVSEFTNSVKKLMERYEVVAPIYVEDKKQYAVITDASQISLDDELPYASPKEVVFGRVERIMRFTEDEVVNAQDIKPVLLLGAAPCDLEALNVLDAVFIGGKFVDPFYKNNRSALVVIGKACNAAKRGCFCKERGVNMSYSTSCDGFMSVDGDTIIFEQISENAKDMFAGAEALINKGTQPAVTLEITADESALFDSMPWQEFTQGCMGCGACTYICPTCHCFEFKDIQNDGVVERYRCWDSCMYPKFTLHASGHNPRAQKFERFRQRVMHKYVYVKKNFGLTACTGCGRCVRLCPGGVSIKKAVEKIQSRLEEQK